MSDTHDLSNYDHIAPRLMDECRAMTDYALSNGVPVPDSVLELVSQEEDPIHSEDAIIRLNHAHRILSKLVAPATPRSIVNLKHETGASSPLKFLGNTQLTRKLTLSTLFFALMLAALFLFQSNLGGYPQLKIFLFLLGASGLGASATMLYNVHKMLAGKTLQTRLTAVYMARLIRGATGGLLLGEALIHMGWLNNLYERLDLQPDGTPILAMAAAFFSAWLFSWTRGDKNPPVKEDREVNRSLESECQAMTSYALASGMGLPDFVVETMDRLESNKSEGTVPAVELNRAHRALSQIVSPARPRTILLLAEESAKPGPWQFLGKVPLVRRLMLAAFIFLTLFVTLSLSHYVKTDAGGILDSSGFPLLLNLLFFISSAGLGASFAALFQANHYIVSGTFDPKYEASYWIRFFLGIIAGLLLSELIPLGSADGVESFGKPTLAMLGGFSAALVYTLLNRLVETVELMFSPDTAEVAAARQEVTLAMQKEIEDLRISATRHIITAKSMVLGEKASGEVAEYLDEAISDLMPEDAL